MSKLPRVSGRDCIRALERAGFFRKRQTGSHVVMRRQEPFAQVVVADHQEFDSGTSRAIPKQDLESLQKPCYFPNTNSVRSKR